MGPGDPFANAAGDIDAGVDVDGDRSPPRQRVGVVEGGRARLAPVQATPKTAVPVWVVPVGVAVGMIVAMVGLYGGVLAALALLVMGGAGGLVAWLGYRMMVSGLHPLQAWRSLLGDDDDR